mmetsp:Transcript_1975/g.2539  ORF Transcript_1975/g.2539 Transcript_1975/m.2539 type:complete len:312 (+) Transcript_1975:260-1195(+)|eukprot:CAMPEP_0204823092 /NCGR_PEP_ID=MMETSP1346-20131115/1228_1 /ASSEMBLY_ACC=CAM_ASM_000771 /TAXON_ID=215587 /ORGANISM="Aplanochytrium stocchinoi, Strain GSBS06" /LENGTH=311 /DNA_ID=CAMNT_0051949625 /DNA_START=201 /DNA_END=1136 /DNA_ORIENTATION=-
MADVFGDKAAKMLGLETASAADSQRRPSAGRKTFHSDAKAGAGKVSVQRSGFLFKKPFYKKGLRNKFQKRYFVLKDSFILWYKKAPPGSCNYGLYPEGCLPVGGCTVTQEGVDNSGYYFGVSHPEFHERLILRAETAQEAQEWIGLLKECKEATWDNALFGDAQVIFLQAKGTAEEKEKENAMAEAQKKAELANKAAAEKLELMEKQMAKQREYKELLRQKEEERENIIKQIEEEVALKKEVEARNLEEEAERMLLEKKLKEAQDAVAQLEETVQNKKGGKSAKDGLLKDIYELKKFLNSDSARPSYDDGV